MTSSAYAALLDLDGTLVDSVYHHVLAWDRALAARGHHVALERIHAGIGMGSARLVPWLLGRAVTDPDPLADAHDQAFLEATEGRLRPTRGALALLDDLAARQVTFQVATSAGGPVAERLLAALGRDVPTTHADDVGAPKPAPDLLVAACAELGVAPSDAVLVGDSPWDAEAARRAGLRCVAVRCGGFSDGVLHAAGADDVVENPRELVGRL